MTPGPDVFEEYPTPSWRASMSHLCGNVSTRWAYCRPGDGEAKGVGMESMRVDHRVNGSRTAAGVNRTWAQRALVVPVLALATVGLLAASASANAKAAADENGKVKIVYHDDEIKPENQQVVQKLKQSRVLEQLADWVNKRVALPHDLVVNVTDAVPPGVADMVTQPDGRTIFIPPSFLNDVAQTNSEVVQTVDRPALFPADKFNVDDLNALSNQFIFGHEMGHALQRQLLLPNLSHEEDAADGFAVFYTVNERGPNPPLAGAILFDALARKEGTLTLEGLSSDHPVTQQRVFNFLCFLDGSDQSKYSEPLMAAGYLPKSRAPFCPQEWAGLNYGWWTQLEPHFSDGFKDQGTKEQKKARAKVIAERKTLEKNLDQLRVEAG